MLTRNAAASSRLLTLTAVALGLAWACEPRHEEDSAPACSATVQCPADHFCLAYPSGGGGGCSGMSDSGVCVRRTPRGGACPYDFARNRGEDVCVSGTICHGAFDPPRCEPLSGPEERCHAASDCAPAGDAEPICDTSRPPEPHLGVCADQGTVPEGLPCQEDRACTAGLACRPGREGGSICRGPGTDGDPCDNASADCADGHHCAWVTPRVCRPDLQDGERCGPEAVCADGLLCREDEGRCGQASEEGGRCLSSHECGAGLSCLDGACAQRGEEGAACTASDLCAPGLRCADGACARPGLQGDPCDEWRDCVFGLWCRLGGCRPLHPWSPEGGVCERTSDCLGGRPCRGGTCLPRSGELGPCLNDRDCTGDLWCRPGDAQGECRQRLQAGSHCVAEHACRSLACDWSTQPPVCAD